MSKLTKQEREKRREQRMREQTELFHSNLIDNNIMDDPQFQKYLQDQDDIQDIRESKLMGNPMSLQRNNEMKDTLEKIAKNDKEIHDDKTLEKIQKQRKITQQKKDFILSNTHDN